MDECLSAPARTVISNALCCPGGLGRMLVHWSGKDVHHFVDGPTRGSEQNRSLPLDDEG